MTPLVATLAALTLSQAPVLAAPASAAAAPAAPVLTLAEALRRGAEANTELRAAGARVEQARAGILKAWSWHLPQVSAGASWTHNRDESSITLPTGYHVRDMGSPQGPAAGGTVAGSPTNLALTPSGSITAILQKADQLGGQLQVTQALLAPQAWFGIQAAYQGADLAAKGAEAARREVLFAVAQAYYGVTSLRKVVGVTEELERIAARQEKDAKVRLEAGAIAKVGYLRAQIDLVRAEQDLVRARNAYASARIALAGLLDRDAAFEVVPPPEPTLPPDLSGLEQGALKARPDLQAARLNEELAATLRRASAARYLPSVGAFYRYQIANVGGFTGKEDAWAAGLALSWTLLDGGLREGELREASARIAEAEAGRRGLEIRVVSEVRQALLDLESARAGALKASEQARLAAENQRLVEVSYRAGAATAVEQADATSALRTAAIAAAADELAAQLAALKVLKVAGEFDPGPRR